METMQKNGTLDTISSNWKFVFTDLADPRTNNWFLISSPIPPFLMLMSYLYFVKVWGPKYMKDKEPYKLNRVVRIYNVIQIAWNSYMFYEGFHMWSMYNWNCQPVDSSDNPVAIRHAWLCYLYFLNKIFDLLDTIFFVFRKKNNQITFLHVFHHTMMVVGVWNVVKYFPGGQTTFIGFLNAFVHILLYGYYYLAAFGPQVQKYLWWKKYLTRIQLIQFCVATIHHSQLLFFDCGYPRWTVIIVFPNGIFFYYLFYDFYNKTYKGVDTKKELISNGAKESAKSE